MDSSPLDWGYHPLPCSTTFNQAPLWSLPISSSPSLEPSASIRSCRQTHQARLWSALVNYCLLVKLQCLSWHRVHKKWIHFYVHALTYLRHYGSTNRWDETLWPAVSKVCESRIHVSKACKMQCNVVYKKKNCTQGVCRTNFCASNVVRN